MQAGRRHSSSLDQGESELFCLEVHLAGIKTCLFSDETCALPSVWLCLLDFEPLIFDGLQRKQGGPSHYAHSNINEDGQGGPPPFVFPCNKGKSCFFEADPARLSQDLRLPGALTLMVVSKLSKRQAAIHGSCPVDLSNFGPNPQLSRFLPRAVSSWGHHTHRVESKDPRGRTVAAAELTVSLSCLGAAGGLFQINAPTVAVSSQPHGMLSSAATVPLCCAPGVAQNTPPGHSPEPGTSVAGEGGETERQSAAAGKRGRRAVARDRSDQTPAEHRGGGGWFGKQEPGDYSWTCEFNPRDGSLTEVAISRLNDETRNVLDTALHNSDNAAGKHANEGENAAIAALLGAGSPSSNREQAHGTAPPDCQNPAARTNEKLHSPSAPGSSMSATPASATKAMAATAPAAIKTVDLELATSAPSTPISAVVKSERDRVPPLPASEGEQGDLGGADKAVVQTHVAEGVSTLETADGIAMEEPRQMAVVLERKASGRILPGNNLIVNAWRPSDTPPEPNGGIELNGWSATTGISGVVAPAGGGRSKGQGSTNPKRSVIQTKKHKKYTPPAAALSTRKQRPDRWRPGVSGGKSNQGLAASTTTRTTTSTTTTARKDGNPTTQRERGKAVRRPWGAGPGLATASTSRGSSRPRPKTSREGRTGGKEYDGNYFPRATSRARPSPPHSAPPKETSPPLLGPTLLEQFLPTWTSLVAEAAWLRRAEATSRIRSGVVEGGGDDGGGDCWSGGGGGCDGERYVGVNGASAAPAKRGERFDDRVSASGASRGGSAERPRQTGMSGISGFERDSFHQGSAGGERSFNRGRGGSRQGCGVPAPSLDPTVESALVDWLKSRIDRNGRLIPPGHGDSSKDAAQGDLEERSCKGQEHRWDGLQYRGSGSCRPLVPPLPQQHHGDLFRHDHEQEPQGGQFQRRDGRISVDDAQHPTAQHRRRSATPNRLHRMFEEALEGLLLQKENMVPATATSRTVEGGGKDGVQSPCDGIGWVEVVRRVSDIAEEEHAHELTSIPTTGQPPRHHALREVEAEEGRGSHDNDHTTRTKPTDGVPPGDGSDDGGPPKQKHGNGTIYPAADSSASADGPPLRPAPICIEPCGLHRPMSPPLRLPPLAEAPRSPPLTSLLSPLASPKGLTASPRRRRPPVAPTAPTASGEGGSRSPQSPGSPRARRWLLDSNGGRQPRGYAADDGGSVVGTAQTENMGARPVPPSACSASSVGHGGREEAGEVREEVPWAPGAQDGSISRMRTTAACRSMPRADAFHADGSTGEEEKEEGEVLMILEEYESDFEDEEDER